MSPLLQAEQFAISPQFLQTVRDLKGSGGANLRLKIFFGMVKHNLQTGAWAKNKIGCYNNLLNIMRNELKCPRTAEKMTLYLDALEFQYNMTKDEKMYQSFIEKNCTWLQGKSARICKGGKYFVHFKVFDRMISKCHFEQMEDQERGGLKLSLHKRFLFTVTPVSVTAQLQ